MTRTTGLLSLAATPRNQATLVALVALAAGCSSDGESGSSTSGGTAGACPATTEIADVQTAGSFLAGGVNGLSLLQPAGDYIYLHDYNAGNDTGITVFPKTGAILRVPKAGGAVEVFYTPANIGETITSFHVSGDDLFTYDSSRDSSKKAKVVRTSLSGRTSTAIATALPSEVVLNVFASDAQSLFYTASTARAGDVAIYRLSRIGGAPEIVTQISSTFLGNVQLQGNDIWFSTIQGAGPLFKVEKSVTAGAASQVSTKTCPKGLLVTADAIVCGGIFEINKLDRTMANPQLLVKALEDGIVSPAKGVVQVLGVQGDTLYYASPVALEKRTGLGRVALTGGATSVMACDRGNILGLAAEAGAVFWFEQRANAAGEAARTLAFKASP